MQALALGGGGVRGGKRVCGPKISLKLPASLTHFRFPRKKNCSDVGGGGKGGGGGLAKALNTPPPRAPMCL